MNKLSSFSEKELLAELDLRKSNNNNMDFKDFVRCKENILVILGKNKELRIDFESNISFDSKEDISDYELVNWEWVNIEDLNLGDVFVEDLGSDYHYSALDFQVVVSKNVSWLHFNFINVSNSEFIDSNNYPLSTSTGMRVRRFIRK